MAQPDLPDRVPSRPTDGGQERVDRESGFSARARTLGGATIAGAARALAAGALGPRARVELVRKLAVPAILALVPLFWVADATHRASLATLGRDQGIFQYVAWAVRLGDVDYRDVRDVNGPLTHLIHTLILALGGEDEHRFRVLDLAATGLSFAAAGACIPGIVAKRAPTILERAAWAFATAVVLGAQYHLFLFWNQAQRESFCDWFLLPSVALQIMRPTATARSARLRIVAVGALSALPWLGKPSFGLFSIVQVAALLFDPDLAVPRRARVTRFALGAALGLSLPLAYLFVYGDPIAFARITLGDVPRIYRFIWAKSAQEIFGEEGPLTTATAGLAASALVLALVSTRKLPRRYLALALVPLAALAGVALQHKGFGYHFHPLTASTHLAWIVVVALLWERYRAAPRGRSLGRLVALGVATAHAFGIASSMKESPHIRNVWILAGGETPERRAKREYFDSFKSHDFFPWELREGARYLADKTAPGARVQVYGMDPYLLFLAKRRSATPYIYAYDLNASAALEGGWSNRPTWLEEQHIRATRDAHEADMLARLRSAPPEAFVFIDNAPLTTFPDAWEDFRSCCSSTATWVATNYHPARSFGEVHVWLRDDLPVPDEEGLP